MVCKYCFIDSFYIESALMGFADEFKVQRKKLNLSQEELAKKIGISRAYITMIENGQRLPGKKHLLKIAEAVKVKKQEVINWYLQELRKKFI